MVQIVRPPRPSALTPRRRPRARGVVAALAASLTMLALAGCTAPPDSAAPSSTEPAVDDERTVRVEELGEGDQTADLGVALAGPIQVNVRRITIPPGAGTGEHCHHGNLIAVVEQGTLTHRAPIYPGGVHEYRTGESIFEGSGYRHEGTNEGEEDVVLVVTYLTPEGEPLAETDLQRCDAA